MMKVLQIRNESQQFRLRLLSNIDFAKNRETTRRFVYYYDTVMLAWFQQQHTEIYYRAGARTKTCMPASSISRG